MIPSYRFEVDLPKDRFLSSHGDQSHIFFQNVPKKDEHEEGEINDVSLRISYQF